MKINIDYNKFDSDLYRPLVKTDIPNFKPGTLSYDDYWDKQDDLCLNGFKPTAYMPRITGNHYFYLNMNKVLLLEPGADRKTKNYPFYRELDRILFNEFLDAKIHHHGIICGKPRRVGLSYDGANLMQYELTFYANNYVGVAAGQDDKAQDFKDKVLELIADVREEYRMSTSVRNDDEVRFSYRYRENKQDIEEGAKSSMYMKTMYAKPTGFEGKTLSIVIFEEAGLFEDIIAALKSTEPCFKEGSVQFGSPIIYGTGGDIEKGSKGYRVLYNNPEKYNLKKIFVSSTDYYPGDGGENHKGEKISFFDFRTGLTDKKAAYDHIIRERKEKEGTEGYIKHLQSYPLKESDIFIKNSGGYLNRKKLNAQKQNLDNCPYEIKTGRLEWDTSDTKTLKLVTRAKNLKEIDKIHFTRKSKVIFVEDEFGPIKKLMDPLKNKNTYFNPDIGGMDSYDDEVKEGTGSEGATIVYRCFYRMDKPYDMPIAFTKDRGSSDADDEYYSNSFRLAVYYDIKILLEFTKIMVKNYFEDVNGLMHLKERPEIEGYTSSAVNQYGFKMPNQYSWRFTLKLLKAEVNQNYGNIWFDEILDDLLVYGDENSDLGSAYGMLLVYKLEMFGELTEDIEVYGDELSDLDTMGTWVHKNGEMVFQTYSENGDDSENFVNVPIFDPEYDLLESEKSEYRDSQTVQRNQVLQAREDILNKYERDIMAFTINEHHRRLTDN